MLCSLCGQHEADPRYREITGWEKTRGVRSQGGHNALVAKTMRPTGRVACISCIIDLRNGLPAGTPKLFDVDGI